MTPRATLPRPETSTELTPAPPRGSEITVRPVKTPQDLTTFIRLPWRLYNGSPLWVPPLLAERRRHLDRNQNPYFEHAEAEYFLAWRNGEAVGRITAQVDHRLNDFQDDRSGQFGFFESENDPAIAAALLDAAAGWLSTRGRDRMLGPVDFSARHESGLLVSGYELPPQIGENWHHPYYRRLLEAQGLSQATDLYKWELRTAVPGQGRTIPDAGVGELEREHGIRLRRMRREHLHEDLIALRDIDTSTRSGDWGFVPLTDRELESMERELRLLLDEDLTCVAETLEGEVVGMSLALADMNKVLSRINGHLLPVGWARLLYERRRIDEVRVLMLAVKPTYQHTGAAAALCRDLLDTGRRRGIRRMESSWIPETDALTPAAPALSGRIVKRYRIYERLL